MYVMTKDLKYGPIKCLNTKFSNLDSKMTIIISDCAPDDPTWIKIQPSDLMNYIYNFDVWYKRKVEVGHHKCYVRPPRRSVTKSSIYSK